MGLTLTDARAIVRQFVRGGNSSTAVSDTAIDNAIKLACDEFIQITRVTRTKTTSVTITSGSAVVSLSALTGFRPVLFFGARVNVDSNYTAAKTEHGILKLDYSDIKQLQGDPCYGIDTFDCNLGTTGTPRAIGFDTVNTAEVFPTPDNTGTMTVWWSEPLTDFTAGTGSPNGVTFNIPDDLLRRVLVLGAATIAQITDPEAVNSALRTGAFADYCRRCMGEGSLGGNSLIRGRR